MDLISVIIPMHNQEKFIEKCLKSLQAQTYSDLEIIVVDDASEDRSRDIVEKMASEDKRIRLIRQEKGTAASTRNNGLRNMSGECFTFVDADDFMLPDYIGHLKKRMDETGTDLVITGITTCKLQEDGTYQTLSEKIPQHYERFVHEEWAARSGEAAGKLYRRTLFDKYQVVMMDDGKNSYGEDMPFALFYFSMCDKISVLPEAGYMYVRHGFSTMANVRSNHELKLPYSAIEETIKMIADLGGPVNGKDFYEWYVLRILSTFIDLSRRKPKEDVDSLSKYIYHIIGSYFPDVKKNRLVKLSADIDVPRMQKMAVAVLVRMYRMKLLRPFLTIYCRFG